jgi:AbrB family looped-hinge helix DNA binding protein
MQVPIPFTVKVVKIGNSLRMTIPKQITDYLKIAEGDTLEIVVTDHTMTVKKKLVGSAEKKPVAPPGPPRQELWPLKKK